MITTHFRVYIAFEPLKQGSESLREALYDYYNCSPITDGDVRSDYFEGEVLTLEEAEEVSAAVRKILHLYGAKEVRLTC